MLSFQDDILAGTTLVRAAINSPNYVQGSTGWAIKIDGSAEFNNVTIRGGAIVGGTLTGTDWIINAAGSFFYSSTPAHGNLVASIASAGGTDGFGNVYQAGTWAYGSAGASAGLGASGIDAALLLVPGGSTHVTSVPQVIAAGTNAGAVNEAEWLVLESGKAGGHDDATIQLISQNANATAAARMVFEFGGSIAVQINKTNVTITTGGGTGFSGTPDISQVDTTVDTNANNGTQPMTQTWAIPALDPQVGTVYEIETTFNGTFQSATLGFKPRLSANPTMVTSGGDVIANTFFGAGAGFAGHVRLKMIVTATGAGGTADFFINGGVGNNGNRSPGVNEAYLSSQATGVAIDTTAANTLVIVSVWGSNVAGQTVVSHGSTFTRKGP